MRNDHYLACFLLAAGCFLCLTGCGSNRAELAQVTGTVTYLGETASQGQITFYPENGRPATGPIAQDGTYRLTTYEPGDGVKLGQHRVTITVRQVSGGAPQPKTFEEEVRMAADESAPRAPAVKVTWLVPEKYSQRHTTPLTREVQSGDNVIDFDLPN